MSKKLTGSNLLNSRTGAVLAILFSLLLTATGFAQQVPASPAQVKAQVAQLPMAFEPNQGQVDSRVKFLSRGTGYILALTRDEAILALGGAKAGARDLVRLKLAGANRNAQTQGMDALEGKTNYFVGNNPAQWHTGIANFSKVRYAQVYPGIDLLYYGKQNSLEHDFIVAPNADPGKIALRVKGAKQLHVDEKGNLVLTTTSGQLQLDKPFIYQTDKNGQHVEIAGGFALQGDRVSFRVGAYDKSRELIIDPVLNYATYFGGNATTTVNAIAVDGSGNAYITGSTASSAATLANIACASCGTPDRDGTTKLDVFVTKLNSSGSAFAFTTIVGGTGDEQGSAIAVDGSGNIYVTGQTASANFPTTTGAFLTAAGATAPDAFVFKLASSGSSLSYSSYLNGSSGTDGADVGTGIAVDAGGNIYVTGSTASTSFFPAAMAVVSQNTNTGGKDAFLIKLNPAGGGTADGVFGTYWGGTSDDVANGIALGTGNLAFIAGYTQSNDFPVSGSTVQGAISGTQDGFVMNMPVGGATISSITCTNSPGNNITIVTTANHNLASGDHFIIRGVGNSAGITFNNTNETAASGTTGTTIKYTTNGGCKNSTTNETGVITAGTSVAVARRKYSTYLGGNNVDEVKAIAVDGSGNTYLTGNTTSTTGFPSGSNAIQNNGLNTTASGAPTDGFIAKLNNAGSTLTYSAYLGGTGNDAGNAVVVNPTCTSGCEAYVVGTTTSGSRFSSNSLQSALSGTQDGFVVRVNSAGNGLIYSTYFGSTGNESLTGAAANYVGTAGATNTLFIAGNTSTTIGAASSFGAGATVTSSAANTAPDATATGSVVVAKLSANGTANPSLGIGGVKSVDPIGQDAIQTSSVNYTWTVTNTNAAKAVTVDIPMPQSSGVDLLTISGTPSVTGTGAAGTCTKKVGSATQAGGLTCELGDLTASGSSQIVVAAQPTAAAHCNNSPCAIPTITQVGKVASAEIGSLVTSSGVVSNLAPIVDLTIAGTVNSNVTGGATYVQGTDSLVTYALTVTNQSTAPTIAANSASLDVQIESDYPANLAISTGTVILNGTTLCSGNVAPTDCGTVLANALVQGTAGCFNDVSIPLAPKLQCNVLNIANAGTATLSIAAALNAAPNATLHNLVTTSKFPPSDTSEIFTTNGNNTNKDFTVVYSGPQSDLQITTFAGSANPIRTGQSLTYTVGYTNAGPTDATLVTITLTPSAPNPANTGKFHFVSNTAGNGVAVVCAQPGGDGTAILCPINNADVTAAAGARSFTVTGTLTLDATVPTSDQLTTAAISTTGTTSDPTPANNSVGVTTTFQRQAALGVSGFSAPATVANTQSFNYTFAVANGGGDDATSSIVTLSLPQNTNSVTFTGNGTVVPTACTGTTTVTCNIGTVTAGASGVVITVIVTPPTLAAGTPSAGFNGSITNIASANVVSTGGTKTAANILTTVQRQTTISVANLANTGSPVASSATAGYTVDVFNNGANIATNVKLDFTVPSGTTTGTAGCAVQAATIIRCNVASVPTGGVANKVTLAVSFTPPASLIPSNQQSAAFSTSVTFNATASTEIVDAGTGALTSPVAGTVDVTVERRADVQMFNLTATPTVSSDGNITVQAQVQNLSGVTATSVQVVFTFDHNYRFVSANVVNANGIANTPAFDCATTFTATTRTCTIPNLPISTLYTFNVIVQPEAGIIATNAPASNKTTVNVSATISAAVVQSPNTGNDTSGPLATEVQRQANLRASGTSTVFTGPVSAINSSASATYNLTVRNDGPDPVANAVIHFTFNSAIASLDTSPAAQTAWGGLGTCIVTQLTSPAVVTCTNAASFPVNTGRSGSITISPDTATLLSGTNSATYNVTADISSVNAYDNGTAGAPGSDNTSATVTTTVQRQADLQLVSKIAPNAVADGGPITYTITVRNNGPDPAGSVRLIDPLPSVSNGTVTAGATGGFTLNANGANFTSPNPPGGVTACTPVSASPTAPPVSVVCMVGPLNSGETATITITGVANIDAGVSSASFNNVATVDAASTAGAAVGTNQTATDTNGGNNSNSVVSTTVSRSADLVMTTVNSTPVLVGGTLDPSGPGTHFVVGTHQSIQYDVTVLNNAISSTSVSTASVQTTLPSTLTFNSAASALVGTCNAAGQVVTCPVSATLTPGGASATVSFVAVPGAALPTSGNNLPITITPSVGAAGNTDPDPSNNAANNTTTIDRVSNLGIAQTAPATPIPVVSPGPAATFTYTWTLNNAGPSNATGVSVTDILPADLQFVSGSWPAVTGTSAGTCTGATTFGATITCNISTMNSGATVTVTVTVRPTLNTALANKFVSNQPQITGQVQDTNSGDNADSDQIELRGVTDLAVTITPVQNGAPTPAGQVLTGDNQTWAVKVTNNGPYPAGSVITLTNSINAANPNVSFVSVQGVGGFVCAGSTCTLSSLAVGAGSAQTVNLVTSTPANAVAGQTTPISTSAVVTQYSNGTNTAADVTDPNVANNTASATVTGRAAADLVVTQNAPAALVGINSTGTKYTVTVANVVGRSDATNVVLTNTIAISPTGAVPTTATGTPTQGSCNAATGLGTATITIVCNLGTVASGTSPTVNLALTPVLDSGSNFGMINTPSVVDTELDPVTGNNSAAPIGIKVSLVGAGQQTFNPTNPSNGTPIPSVVISGFINTPGGTTMVVGSTSPNPNFIMPVKYQFGNAGAASNFYTISNTAVFNSAIQVCFATTETFFQPSKVRVFQLSGNPAVDVTVTAGYDQVVNGSTPERQVCGSVNSLASTGTTFVVMEPTNTVPDLANAKVTTSGGGKGSAGTSASLDGSTVVDPDAFRCMKVVNGSLVDSQCTEQSTLIFRWIGNFTDVATIDPATGLKVITKDCTQPQSSFVDGLPCTQAATSLGLGSNTVTLQVFDDFSVLNPPPATKTFPVGVSGGGSGGIFAQTVTAGQTGTFTFSYTYTANTTFAFVGSPSLSANGITCSAQPLTYTGPVGGTQTSNVTVLCSTSGAVFASNSPQGNRNDGSLLASVVGLTGLPLVGMVLMPGGSRRQRKLKMFAIFALIALMVVFSASCGGGSSSGSFGGAPKLVSAGTAKGDYVITVTATPPPSGPAIPTLTLTVQ